MITKRIHEKGQALVAAIVIVIMLGLFAVSTTSLMGVQVGHSAIGLTQSTQAFYLAHAGLEWYMQQLADDADWTDQTTPITQNFGPGIFYIELTNVTASSMVIKSTGRVQGAEGRFRERFVSATVRKGFPGMRFAVFWFLDGPGSALGFVNNNGGTHINGDFWSVGSSRIGSKSDVVNGIVYYGQGESITGSGLYDSQEVLGSVPQMGMVDTTYYDNSMINWNNMIDVANNSGFGQNVGSNLILTSNVDWTGQTINARIINTNGFNISGSNFIVSCRNFNLQGGSQVVASNFTISCRRGFAMSQNSAIRSSDFTINSSAAITINNSRIISSGFRINSRRNFDVGGNGASVIRGSGSIVSSINGRILLHNNTGGSLTVRPSGGNIDFLSGDNLIVGSSSATVNLHSGCFLYSRNPSGNNDLVRIRNNATVRGSTIMAERRVIIEKGADVIDDSIVYVDTGSANRNNYLQVTGNGTTVDGSVISMGTAHPSLRINSGASITGLVYQYGSDTRGRVQVNGRSTIRGSLLVRQFQNTSFGPCSVTGDLLSIPNPLPPGFADNVEVYVESNTWDGL